MTVFAAAILYNMAIVQLFSNCSLLKPKLTQTQVNRIFSFEQRANKIIGYKQCQKKEVIIWKQRICLFVYKVVMGEVDDPFENYF